MPDVSVILAVHNSLPQLTECLTSLMAQSIGSERMQVVAVDAGSTDGSAAELERFAARHPQTLVLRQSPGRGPAGPNNRGLECATGRYVFFVCPDDHLGPQALERLVDAADRWESDVVGARMVGVNGRHVPVQPFETTQRDVDFFAGALPWGLSGIRFFRRALVERHRLRFPEDMTTGSEQPFAIEACLQARRISVLGDYDYYYAVKRGDRRHARRTSWEERLRCAQRLVEFDVVRLDPGPRRDALLQRHFGSEVAKLLRVDFLDLDLAAQRQIHAVVQKLTTQYLGVAVEARLPHGVRQRLAVVRHGNLEDLRILLRQLAEPGKPRVVVENGRWYRPLHGFRDERFGLPAECYDISEQAGGWVRRFTAIAMNWRTTDDGELVLSVNARNPWRHLAAVGPEAIRITAGDATAVVRMLADEVAGTVAFIDLPVTALIDAAGPEGRRQLPVRLHTEVGGDHRAGYLKLKGRPSAPRRMIRRGARVYLVTPYTNNKGRLVVAVAAVTPRRLVNRLRRMLPAAGR